jgi:hypothetical protein
VVNRVHPDPALEPAGGAGRPPTLDAACREVLIEVFRDQQRVARRERRAVARLEVDAGESAILVPQLESDVHDLRGLEEVGNLILPVQRARGRRRRGERPSRRSATRGTGPVGNASEAVRGRS